MFEYTVKFKCQPTDPAFDSLEALQQELDETIESQGIEAAVDELLANIETNDISIELKEL